MKTTLALLAACCLCGVLSAGAQAPADAYKAKCAVCHGPEGNGQTPAGKALAARDFSSAAVKAETDAQLETILANGKNKMPAFGKQLTPPQIQAMVAYVRKLGKGK